MTRFVKATGGRPTGWFDDRFNILSVTMGPPIFVGLEGGYDDAGNTLVVRPGDFGSPDSPITVEANDPDTVTMPIRHYKITPKKVGFVFLEARVQSTAPNWMDWPFKANVQIAVKAGPSDPTEIVQRLFYEGQFSFATPGAKDLFVLAMNNQKVDGRVAEHSLELQKVLIKLAPAGLKILRTFANETTHPRNPHGEQIGTNKYVCRAVDIAAYAGTTFHYLQPKETLISGAERLLRDLPSGQQYDMGFVRPVGGETGFDTRLDVFFNVPQDRVAAAYSPDGSWGMGAMLPGPKPRIVAAAGGKLNYVYPDGADHMHLKALAAT
jgi:hypothetical protein